MAGPYRVHRGASLQVTAGHPPSTTTMVLWPATSSRPYSTFSAPLTCSTGAAQQTQLPTRRQWKSSAHKPWMDFRGQHTCLLCQGSRCQQLQSLTPCPASAMQLLYLQATLSDMLPTSVPLQASTKAQHHVSAPHRVTPAPTCRNCLFSVSVLYVDYLPIAAVREGKCGCVVSSPRHPRDLLPHAIALHRGRADTPTAQKQDAAAITQCLNSLMQLSLSQKFAPDRCSNLYCESCNRALPLLSQTTLLHAPRHVGVTLAGSAMGKPSAKATLGSSSSMML